MANPALIPSAIRPHRPHPGQRAWPLATTAMTGLVAAVILVFGPDVWYLLLAAAIYAYGAAACLIMPFYLPARATPDHYATPRPVPAGRRQRDPLEGARRDATAARTDRHGREEL